MDAVDSLPLALQAATDPVVMSQVRTHDKSVIMMSSVPSNPVIVVLNDDLHLLKLLEELVKRNFQHPRLAVSCFSENLQAKRFVMGNRNRIIGYIQDLNRLGDGGPGAGIRFYNEVIDPMTPAAKTIIFSVSIDFHPDFKDHVERYRVDKIRLVDSTRVDSRTRIEDLLSWLQSPVQAQGDSPLTAVDNELVRVIAPPWYESGLSTQTRSKTV